MKSIIIGDCQLIHGDSIEVMERNSPGAYPEATIKAIISDPPYKLTSGGKNGLMGGCLDPDEYDNSGALVDCSIDWPDFMPLMHKALELYRQGRCDGIVAVGTTGESATLDEQEHLATIRRVVELVAGRIPVIAGTGAGSTALAVEHTRAACEAGVDAVLVVTPYYTRPPQEGLYRHFSAVADAASVPLLLYNVPSRTACDLLPETVERLSGHPQVIGIKDASGDLARVTQLRAAAGADFCQLSGNDDLWLAHAAMGGVGCISVSANVAPRLCADFAALCAAGDWAAALVLHDRLFALHKAMFADASPAPAKYALSRLHGWFDAEVRLPIVAANAAARAAVDLALAQAGLI